MSLDKSELLLKDGSGESYFLFLRHFFFLSHFFFFDDESYDDFFDDKSDDNGSGYGLSGICPYSCSVYSVGCVSGIFSFSRVIGIFSFS